MGGWADRVVAGRRRVTSRGSKGFLTIGAAVAVLVGGLAVAFGAPEHSRLLDLLTGHGWLTTDSPDQVVLANGQTGRLDFRLTVGKKTDPLDVVQSGGNALLVDQKTGDAGSIDVGNLKIVGSRPLGAPGALGTASQPSSLDQVLPGPNGHFYVVNRKTGEVKVTDPVTHHTVTTNLGKGLSPAVVGSNGTMWTIRTSTGAMVSIGYSHDSLHVQTVHSSVVGPGDDVELSVVNGAPAVLDKTRSVFFSAPGGVPGPAVTLPATIGHAATVAPAVTGPVVPLAASGQVVLVDHDQANVVALNGRSGHRLGAPATFAGRVFVPDLTTGSVVVLDDTGQQVGTPIGVTKGSAPQLNVDVQNGALFINDPTTSTAYSVTTAGLTHRIAKNNPNVPSTLTAITTPTTSTTTTTTTTTTTPPPTTPATTPPPTAPPTPVTPTSGATGGSTPPTTVPASVPAAPGNPSAQAGDKSATITWVPPTSHGSALTGYTISWTAGGGGSMTVAGNQSSAKVTGLKNGTSYTFSVKATNAVGTGPAGQTTPVTPTSAIPDPPTSVSAKAQSDGSILVSWTAANGQGHPISYYSVTATPSSGAALAPVKATGTSATLTTAQGLTLGTSYTFTVTSTSSTGGTSKPSTPSNAVTAHTVPLSVSNLVATPGNDQISLTWSCDPTTAACSGGSTVTKFDVTVSPAPSGSSPAPVTASTGQSSYNTVVTGLVNGVAYTVSVSACNALGCTPTTLSGSITPATVPAPPSITGSVSGTTISWSWNIPNANGSAVTSFVVSINGSEVANSMATSYSAGYGYAQTVTISVTAVNGVGQSPASTNSQRTVTPPPPPPPSPSVTIKLGASATTPGCTSSCYWIDVSFAHMPANSSFDLVCYQNGSKYFDSATYGFTYKSNSSGSGSYAPTNKSPDGCASGTGKVYVTINSVSSKSITT